MVRQEILRPLKVKNESEIANDFGATGMKIKQTFYDLFKDISTELGKHFNIIYVTYTTVREDKEEGVAKIVPSIIESIKVKKDPYKFNLSKFTQIDAILTVVAGVNSEGQRITKRKLIIAPTESFTAGNRMGKTDAILDPT